MAFQAGAVLFKGNVISGHGDSCFFNVNTNEAKAGGFDNQLDYTTRPHLKQTNEQTRNWYQMGFQHMH